ncbi:unnamed protein product [Callosobruchus maculatus]|uniref:Uncharacterized protein n=1 Tax=Callosobruchus maculatus TaxID=64391 RepID=A0A653C2H5_CALMS|nr:unnamed protein product [Callosobruchus maculatus]
MTAYCERAVSIKIIVALSTFVYIFSSYHENLEIPHKLR